MKVFIEIIEHRRRELLLIWGIFTLFIFSEYMYRIAHQTPYYPTIAWEYIIGFLAYMIGPWFLTIFLFIIAYIIGRAFLGFAVRGLKFRTDLEETLFCTGTGFGFISTATYIIGLSRLLYPFIFGIASIFIIAAGYRQIIHLFRVMKRGFSPLKWDILDGFLLFLLGLFILNTLLNPNNPSTGYDSINSHLCAPKWYLREHAVHFLPWINFNNFPQITEMLFTLQMMVFKDPGASVIYLSTLMIVGATWLIGSRYFGRKAGLVAAIVLLINEKILYLGRLAMVDQILGFYAIMMLLSVLAWWESRDRKWLVLLGIVGGLSCGVKYTGMVNLLMTLIVLGSMIWLRIRSWETEEIAEIDREYEAVRKEPDNSHANRSSSKNVHPLKKKTNSQRKSKDRKKHGENNNSNQSNGHNSSATLPVPNSSNGSPTVSEIPDANRRFEPGYIKSLGIVLLWAFIFALPWYIQSIVLFGNPFFPFYENIFGGLGIGTLNSMRASLAVDHTEMLKYFRFEPNIRNILALPWNFTFHNNGPWLWQDTPGPVGPFYLAFSPAFLFVRKWRRAGLFLIIYLFFYFSYWFLLERMEDQRYMTSVYPLVSILVGWGVSCLFGLKAFNFRNRVHVAWLFLVLTIFFGFFYKISNKNYNGTILAFTEDQRYIYLRDRYAGYDLVRQINNAIASGAPGFTKDMVIYGLGQEDRRFFMECKMIGGIFGYASHFEFVQHAATGQELYDYLKGLGCDYLLYDKTRTLRMAYALTIELPTDDTFTERFEQIGRSGDVFCYHLLGPGESRMVPLEGAKPGEESGSKYTGIPE